MVALQCHDLSATLSLRFIVPVSFHRLVCTAS